MLPSSMDIIDLSSDSEEGIIDLSSDSEDNTLFLPYYREEDVDYDDPSPFLLPFFPHNTAPDWNSMEELDDWRVVAKKEYDDWFRTNASSSYSPVEDISTTEVNNKVSNNTKRTLSIINKNCFCSKTFTFSILKMLNISFHNLSPTEASFLNHLHPAIQV
jgi:hypothetical protein